MSRRLEPLWRGANRGEHGGSHDGRGGYGASRGLGRGFASGNSQAIMGPDPIAAIPTGDLITTFTLSQLVPSVSTQSCDLRISGPRFLTSYNWLDSKTPTILIPGEFANDDMLPPL